MPAEVGTAYVAIMPSVEGFPRALNHQIGPGVADAGRHSGGIFGGAFAKAAGLLAGVGVVAGLKSAIDLASDLNESTSKTQVVFKKFSKQVIATSKTSAAAMGLSSGAYLEATSTLGNLLVSLEVAPKTAADMSQSMVALAGDLASFNNVPIEDALAAIKSGLVGEQEPLRAFGVSITDLTLHAEAFRIGLIKNVKDALDPQSKALAVQSLIMKQTGTAQGDFARTSSGLANSQRILAAKFDDTKAKIGKAFLPVMQSVVGFLGDKALPAFEHLWNSLSTAAGPAVAAAAGWFKDTLLPVLKEVAGWVQDHLVAAWNFLSDAFTRYVMPAIKAVAKVLVGLWQAAQPVIASLWAGFQKVAAFVRLHLTRDFGHLRDIFVNHVVPAFKAVGTALIDTAKWIIKTFGPAAAWVMARLGDMLHFINTTFVPAIKWVFDYIRKNANWMVPIVVGIGAAIVAWKALAFIMALNPFVRIMIIIIALGTFIQQHWEAIKAAFAKAWQQITTAIHVAWDAIYKFFKTIITNIVAAFNNSIDWLVQAGKNIFTGFMTGVHWVWNNILYPFFVGIPKAIGGWFVSALTWLAQAGKNILTGLWHGIQWVWDNVIVGFFFNLPKTIGNWFVNAVTWLLRAGWSILKGLMNGIGQGAVEVWNWFKALPGKIANFLIGLPGKLYDIAMNALRAMWQGFDDGNKGRAKVFGDDFIGGIKDVLGIHSPSTVFMEIGRQLSAGLIRGLIKDNPVAIATKIFGDMPKAIKGLFGANKLSTEDIMGITNPKYKGLIGSILGGLGSGGLGGMFTGPAGPVSGDLSQWLHRAMAITGVPESWYAPLVSLVMHESGGNPRAINLWDRNAVAGTPSKGLLQTIDPTFNAYALPGMGDIWNPVDNAVAAIRYMIARYGSIFQIASYTPNGFVGGYEQGTNYVPRTGLALVHQGEAIIPKAYNQTITSGATNSASGGLDFGRTVEAFREAMRGMRVELDGQLVGRVQAAYSTRLARR